MSDGGGRRREGLELAQRAYISAIAGGLLTGAGWLVKTFSEPAAIFLFLMALVALVRAIASFGRYVGAMSRDRNPGD